MKRTQIGAGRPPRMVSMEKVDLESLPFKMSFGHEDQLELLLLSIQHIGIINPPILREARGPYLEIVIGQRRIEVLKALGTPHFPARVVTASEAGTEACLLAALYDNLTTRTLNPMETALVLEHLCGHFLEQEVISRFLPLMGLPRRARVLELYLGCLRELEPAMQRALAQGMLSLRAVENMLLLDREARASLFGVISELRMNTNQQIQLIELTNDLAHQTESSIPQCLDAPRIQEILKAQPPNPPQQARRLLQELRKARYPRLSRAEETFHRRVQDLDLPQGVSIQAPPFFEAPGYRMEIRFRCGQELKERLEALCNMSELDSFEDPWEKGRA